MYQLTGINKHFQDGKDQRQLFENFTYEFQEQHCIGITGPSGSGKSTLLMMLAGLISPDSGSIVFHSSAIELNLSLASRRQRNHFRRHQVGFIYQFFNLLPTLSTLENVLLPLELTSQHELKLEAIQRLKEVGLEERMHAPPSELSGGEQQRVAIARALAHHPSVVLADEPTGNLDRRTAEIVIDFLWREAKTVNAALIVASHDEAVISRCDRVLALD